jgi:hypothetical protein
MKLMYRGVEYNYTPVATATTKTAVDEKVRSGAVKARSSNRRANALQRNLDLVYRGASYAIADEAASNLPAGLNLVYRGVRYVTGAPAITIESTTVAPTVSLADQLRLLAARDRQVEKQQHQMVLERFSAEIGQ